LGGKAENATERNLATKFANDVNGVKSVENRMTIELSESKAKVTVVSLPAGMVMQEPAVGIGNQKGGSHVVDDRCHNVGSVAAGDGERLYYGLCYSRSAGHCNRCDIGWGHSGAKIYVNDFGK
jgi:hypothetical protein